MNVQMNARMNECTDRRMKMLIGSIKETENGYAGDMVRAIL